MSRYDEIRLDRRLIAAQPAEAAERLVRSRPEKRPQRRVLEPPEERQEDDGALRCWLTALANPFDVVDERAQSLLAFAVVVRHAQGRVEQAGQLVAVGCCVDQLIEKHADAEVVARKAAGELGRCRHLIERRPECVQIVVDQERPEVIEQLIGQVGAAVAPPVA